MNDEVLNEIEKVAPIITDEAKKLFAEQDAELGIEQPTVDQGQAQQATTDQSQQVSTETTQQQSTPVEAQPVEKRGPTRKELKERLREKKAKGEKVTFGDTFGGQSADLRNPFNWANYASAAGAGYVDFLTDTVNLVPGVNLPKLPKYESSTLQGIRQMSSIIIPSLSLAGFLKKQGASAHAKVKWAMGDKRLVKWFGSAGIDAAAGAAAVAFLFFSNISLISSMSNISGYNLSQ